MTEPARSPDHSHDATARRLYPPDQLARGLDLLAKSLGPFYLSSRELELLGDAAQYILGATDSLREHMAEVTRLRAEVASLRLTLGGRTFSGSEAPDPIGCPMPGACAQVAELGRLRTIVRVNALRAGATDAEIDEVLDGR